MNFSTKFNPTLQSVDYPTLRRESSDRRDFNATTIFKGLINPRRINTRRSSDIHTLMDVYGWSQMLSSIILLTLSAADAVFTLIIIQRGGEELNPIMDYFLLLGTSEFIYIKMLIPCLCIFFFVASWNYRFLSIFRMCTFVYMSLSIYVVLVIYELFLINTNFSNVFTLL